MLGVYLSGQFFTSYALQRPKVQQACHLGFLLLEPISVTTHKKMKYKEPHEFARTWLTPKKALFPLDILNGIPLK